MKNNDILKLIIIGSGPAGLSAGVYAGRANLAPLIIDGPQPGGQLMGTTYVENWVGEKRILGHELMKKMREHVTNSGCSFLSENIDSVDFTQQPFRLFTHKKKELRATSIILASGATPKKLNCPGEEKYWGKGVTTCAVCDGPFYKDKPIIIVGGGDTAMEDASFMTNFTNKITVVQILDSLTASHSMQQRVLNNKSIKIIHNSTVTEILGDEKQVHKVIITNQKTQEQKEIPANGVFIAIGLKPNTEPFQKHLKLDKWGYLILHDHTKTSVEGIFGAGDIADFRYRQAITAAGAGCMAALDAEKYIKNLKK